ncbi:MAG: hypothetical protein WC775_04090 [Patescibacteria group bacterium]|jgi:hypothetical protein
MKKYVLLFLICLVIYGAHFIHAGHGIYGDGNGYWSYTHSLYFQHNLDLKPIYAHLKNFTINERPVPRLFWGVQPTKTGALPNHWLIGTSLLWLPGMVVLGILTHMMSITFSPYHLLWEIVPGISGVLMGVVGLYFIEKTISRLWNNGVAVKVAFILFATSNLIYYVAIEPALSHSAIFCINSVFVYTWVRLNPKYRRTWLIWGLLVGLSAIIRITGILIAVLPLYTFLRQVAAPEKHTRRHVALFFLYILGIFISLTPQLIVQQVIYGSVFSQPYARFYVTQQGVSAWWLPQALFSAERGLFVWNPVYLIALWGLIRWSKTNVWGRLSLTYLLLLLVAVGFWGGVLSAGFGNRFFIEALPIFALGLAHTISRISTKNLYLLYGSLFIWNMLLIIQFFGDRPRLVDQKGLTYANLISGQFSVPLQIILKRLQ